MKKPPIQTKLYKGSFRGNTSIINPGYYLSR